MNWLVAGTTLAFLATSMAGCITEEPVVPGASQWQWDIEQSMLPDFTGTGDSYPFMAIHSHVGLSKKQAEENQYIVCTTLGGQEIELTYPAGDLDMAPCLGPIFDQGTGRLFVESSDFESWNATAVIALDQCEGAAFSLGADLQSYLAKTPEHSFKVEFADGTFIVDGHEVQPGQTLKVSYWIDRGDDENERMVKMVFDYAGQWLTSLVGPRNETEAPQNPPTVGSGDHVFVDIEDGTMDAVLAPIVEHAGGESVQVVEYVVHRQGTSISDIFIVTESNDVRFTWQAASIADNKVLVIAARSVALGGGISVTEFMATFPASPHLGMAQAVTTSTWYNHEAKLENTVGIWPAQPPGCECDFVWAEHITDGPEWYPVSGYSTTPSEGELTLTIIGYAADGSSERVHYYVDEGGMAI